MTLVDSMGMTLVKDSGPSQFLFEEVGDLDLSSLYPSIIIALNLAPETFIKKLYITVYNEIEKCFENVEDKFIDEYIAKDYVAIGHKYLGLPSIEQWVDIVNEHDKLVA